MLMISLHGLEIANAGFEPPAGARNRTDNQPLYCAIFIWESLTVHGNELRLFMGQGISPTLTIYVAHLT